MIIPQFTFQNLPVRPAKMNGNETLIRTLSGRRTTSNNSSGYIEIVHQTSKASHSREYFGDYHRTNSVNRSESAKRNPTSGYIGPSPSHIRARSRQELISQPEVAGHFKSNDVNNITVEVKPRARKTRSDGIYENSTNLPLTPPSGRRYRDPPNGRFCLRDPDTVDEYLGNSGRITAPPPGIDQHNENEPAKDRVQAVKKLVDNKPENIHASESHVSNCAKNLMIS